MDEQMTAYRCWYETQRADELADLGGCIPSEVSECPVRAETPHTRGPWGLATPR